VTRDVTERPEGIDAGVARLVGTSEERIVAETLRLLRDPAEYDRMASGRNPYGDGTASAQMREILDRLI
jgi:UDP-N-acetylglucosamine 2-epimerase